MVNQKSVTKNIHPLTQTNVDPLTKQINTSPIGDLSTTIPNYSAYIILLFIFVISGVFIWQYVHRKEGRSAIYNAIADNAQLTLDDLLSGNNFIDTIILCYANMCKELKKNFGIERNTAMTTREFENRLVELGFPNEAVINLTRLFEDVRYGTVTPSFRDEQRAITSLKAIVHGRKLVHPS